MFELNKWRWRYTFNAAY